MSQNLRNSLLFIISGPSGAGKGTLIKHVTTVIGTVSRLVTYTTRDKRPGEEEGIDYLYVSQDRFHSLIASKEIIEYTRTYGDQYYGSPASLLQDQGQDQILEMDYQGMLRIRAMAKRKIVSIFIIPPSTDAILNRINRRYRESNTEARIQTTIKQVQFAWSYDYILINEDLNQFLKQIEAIIESEICRRNGVNYLIEHRQSMDDTI